MQHTYGLGLRLRIVLNLGLGLELGVWFRIGARVEVRVRASVSYIMTIWRWEEFSRCDKFSTTPGPAVALKGLVDKSPS